MAQFENHLSQIILYVQDMASEVQFYRDFFEMAILYPLDVADFANAMWVELDAGSFTLALHGGAKESPNDKHELVFTVEDIHLAHKALMAAGIKIGDIRPLETGAPIATGLDPNGHRFSIREEA